MARNAKTPLESSDFYRLQVPGEPQISPDGARVAYVVQRFDAARGRTLSSIVTRALTAADDSGKALVSFDGVGFPRWSPDGQWITFTRWDDGMPRGWVVPSAEQQQGDDQARCIVRDDFVVGPVTISPTGSMFAAIALRNEPKLLANYAGAPQSTTQQKLAHGDPVVEPRIVTEVRHKMEGFGFYGGQCPHLCVGKISAKHVEVKEPLKQLTSGRFLYLSYCWSPCGNFLATVRAVLDSDVQSKMEICVVDVASAELAVVHSDYGIATSVRFSPNGRKLAFIFAKCACGLPADGELIVATRSDQAPKEWTTQRIESPSSGALGVHILADPECAVEFALSPQWKTDQHVVVAAAEQGCTVVHEVELAHPPRFRKLDLESWSAVAIDVRENGMAFVASRRNRPVELFWRDQKTLSQLTALNQWVDQERELGKARQYTVKSGDGSEIECWYIAPVQAQRDNIAAPCVVVFHGGSCDFGEAFYFQVELFASQGFGVVIPNMRGSISYGKEFTERIVCDWSEGPSNDGIAALDFAQQQGWAAKDRVGVMGWSLGGVAALAALKQRRFRAGVLAMTPTNIQSLYGTSCFGPSWVTSMDGRNSWEHGEELSRVSLLHLTKQIDAAVLLLHGEADLVVPIAQSEELFVALRSQGKNAVMVRYPGQAHWGFPDPRLRVDFCERALAWFTHYLR